MSTSWMAPLGGLPGLGAAVLAGVVAVLALICYCRAGAVPALPPRREVLEFCASQLAGATTPAEVRTILGALEALGQAGPDARRAVLDVVCGYLRRPSRPPGDTAEIGTAGPAARAAAQALLHARLVPQHGRSQHGGSELGSELWSGLHLDLSRASVQDLDLHKAVLRSATFAGTRFSGVTRLTGLRCAGRVVFTDAVFTGPVLVDDVDFTGPVRFTGARFDTTASFTRTDHTHCGRLISGLNGLLSCHTSPVGRPGVAILMRAGDPQRREVSVLLEMLVLCTSISTRFGPTGVVSGHQAGDAADQEIRHSSGAGFAQCSSSARLEVRRRLTCSGWEPPSSCRHPAAWGEDRGVHRRLLLALLP
jgi:Pentapeptide repeats (9 copies)/Pentapeptide repeats (8 copies)